MTASSIVGTSWFPLVYIGGTFVVLIVVSMLLSWYLNE